MNTSHRSPGERIIDIRVDNATLTADLADGRSISAPLAWFPRLLHATKEALANWQIGGGGYGVHWPELDEDLSSEGLLRGAPAHSRSQGAA